MEKTTFHAVCVSATQLPDGLKAAEFSDARTRSIVYCYGEDYPHLIIGATYHVSPTDAGPAGTFYVGLPGMIKRTSEPTTRMAQPDYLYGQAVRVLAPKRPESGRINVF